MLYSIYPKLNDKYSYNSIEEVFKDFEKILSDKDLKSGFTNFKNISFDKDTNSFTITCAIPGFKKEDLEMQYANNTLNLKSTVKGRLGNTLSLSYKVPVKPVQEIDNDLIAASLEDGILTVTLPVKESVKSKRITIS
jgi:HSP20 family protein